MEEREQRKNNRGRNYIVDNTLKELHNEDAENTRQGANRSIFHTCCPLISLGEYCSLSRKHNLHSEF